MPLSRRADWWRLYWEGQGRIHASSDSELRGPIMASLLRARIVLLCEDDPDVAAVFADILEDADYHVVRAPDGEAALRMASKLRPSAIVLDLDLPGPDGVAVLTRLKADPRTAPIPVVIASANLGWLTFLDRGAAAVLLEKPCSVEALEDAVRAAQDSARQAQPAATPPG